MLAAVLAQFVEPLLGSSGNLGKGEPLEMEEKFTFTQPVLVTEVEEIREQVVVAVSVVWGVP